MVTLCGQPDWQVILWDWEKQRLMCKVSIGLSGPIVASPSNFIISWNPCVHDAQSGNVLVTGPQNTFKYLNYKREEKGEVLTIEHSQINYLEEGR